MVGISVRGYADNGLPWGANVKPTQEMPREIEDVGIDEHLGSQVDPSLAFRDEDGNPVTLKTYFDLGKPIVLSPVLLPVSKPL